MTYEVYRYIFIGGAALAGIMLLVSLLLFFLLHIPAVIGDLTGATARKAIEDIRSQNTKSGDKTYKSSQVNRERGRVTDKMTPSGRLLRHPSGEYGGAMATEKISTSRLNAEAEESFATTLLEQSTASNETTVLTPDTGGETTVLTENQITFQIVYEITFVHTNEVIS